MEADHGVVLVFEIQISDSGALDPEHGCGYKPSRSVLKLSCGLRLPR